MDSWEDNFNNYKSSSNGFEEYYNQPVEKDVRKAGREFVNSLTPEKFDEYKRKAGVK